MKYNYTNIYSNNNDLDFTSKDIVISITDLRFLFLESHIQNHNKKILCMLFCVTTITPEMQKLQRINQPLDLLNDFK